MAVKSVALVENGVALFPDAPAIRETRHLKEPVNMKLSAVFCPNDKTRDFADVMRQAVQSGVRFIPSPAWLILRV